MRQAAVDWLERRFGVTGLTADQVLPTIGSKELIGNLPTQLGLGPDDLVVVPELAYPTYEVGARYAGCQVVGVGLHGRGSGRVRPAIVFINSPANPHGKILGADHLRKMWPGRASVGRCSSPTSAISSSPGRASPRRSCIPTSTAGRSRASWRCTRCRSGRTWRATAARSSAGDAAVRRASCWRCASTSASWCRRRSRPPWLAALADDSTSTEQRAATPSGARRCARRSSRRASRSTHSQGSLYLWATRDEPCRDTIDWLAERGILAAPGDFYGPAGARHVRVAFTATDERVAAAVARLTSD